MNHNKAGQEILKALGIDYRHVRSAQINLPGPDHPISITTASYLKIPGKLLDIEQKFVAIRVEDYEALRDSLQKMVREYEEITYTDNGRLYIGVIDGEDLGDRAIDSIAEAKALLGDE